MQDLAPMEKVNAMVGIVERIAETDLMLKHRFASLRYGTAARAPTEADAAEMEEFLVSELNLIESNERVEESMRESSWHLQEVPGTRQINAVATSKPPTGNEKPPPPKKKKEVCRNFLRGKCQNGSDCKYVHDEKAKKEFEKKQSEEPQKRGLCYFFNKPSGCHRGDKCKFLHEHKPGQKPESLKPGGATDAKPTVSVILCGMQSQKRGDDTRVLMDSAANEVVRPYNSFWWKEIIVFKIREKLLPLSWLGARKSRLR